jgi:hypothetical protein
MDNKYWITETAQAISGYSRHLDEMKPDVAYCLTKLGYNTLNCAVEEATVSSKRVALNHQDMFVRSNITSNDTLVVSIGGNDIALRPSFLTIVNILALVALNSTEMLESRPLECWGMKYFIKMFKDDVQNYIKQLVSDTKPRKVLVCTVYYPDQNVTSSWAGRMLGLLGYNKNPKKLQAVIRAIYIHATSNIHVDGVNVVSVPLFNALDPSDSTDYIERVEPSTVGSYKIARMLVDSM